MFPRYCSEVKGSFYLRLTVDDRPGQLAQVAEALSDQGGEHSHGFSSSQGMSQCGVLDPYHA